MSPIFFIKESEWKMRNKMLPFFSTGYYLSNGTNKGDIRKNEEEKSSLLLDLSQMKLQKVPIGQRFIHILA